MRENSCLTGYNWRTHTSHGPEHRVLSAELPPTAAERNLSFTAAGYTRGTVTIDAGNAHQGDAIRYSIRASHPQSKALDSVSVCMYLVEGGGYKMAVFVSSPLH
jgi:hypothetical protein